MPRKINGKNIAGWLVVHHELPDRTFSWKSAKKESVRRPLIFATIFHYWQRKEKHFNTYITPPLNGEMKRKSAMRCYWFEWAGGRGVGRLRWSKINEKIFDKNDDNDKRKIERTEEKKKATHDAPIWVETSVSAMKNLLGFMKNEFHSFNDFSFGKWWCEKSNFTPCPNTFRLLQKKFCCHLSFLLLFPCTNFFPLFLFFCRAQKPFSNSIYDKFLNRRYDVRCLCRLLYWANRAIVRASTMAKQKCANIQQIGMIRNEIGKLSKK